MSEYATSKGGTTTFQEALILISRQTEQNKKKIFYLEQENKRLRVTMDNFSNNFQQKLIELEAKVSAKLNVESAPGMNCLITDDIVTKEN